LIKQHRSGTILNANPNFSRDELYRIINFLIDQHTPTATSSAADIEIVPSSTSRDSAEDKTTKPSIEYGFSCKKCQSKETEAKYGKYGYYVFCPQ
ncbi:nuclease, partial [Vibrio sp. 10N.222.55.E8]